MYSTRSNSSHPEIVQNQPAFSHELSIVLAGGLWQQTATEDLSVFADMQLDLRCGFRPDASQDFHCDEAVWGYSVEFNKADHDGKLTRFEVERVKPAASQNEVDNTDLNDSGLPVASRIQLQIQMWLNPDKWSERGIADYEIELTKQGNQLKGNFCGTHNGRPVVGQVFGTLQPLASLRSGFVPVQPGEHPRLLFRRQDLPTLRKKVRCSVGCKLVAALKTQLAAKPVSDWDVDDAVGYGLLYQLQDSSSAAAARKILQRQIETPIASGPHDRPAIALKLAMAYDLVYETCDPPLRQQINDWLSFQASLLLSGTDRVDFNPTPWSNWNGLYRAALGTIALTLLGEPGSYVAAPVPPVRMSLNPLPQFSPGQGVPVNLLEPDRMPTQWLFAGPFYRQHQEDVLMSIGGVGKATPQAGTAVTYRGTTHRFQPLDPKYIWSHPQYTGEKPLLDIANPVNRAERATAYYYTTVENDQPRWLRVGIRTPYGDARLYLAGQRLAEGDALYLNKGLYPLLVEAEIEPRSGWRQYSGMVAVEPRLISTTAEAAEILYRQRRILYERDRDRWQAGYDAYLATGEKHPTALSWNQIAARNIRRFLGTALGEWGWNSEGENYTQWTMELVLPYIHAYRNVIGIELLPAIQLLSSSTEKPGLSGMPQTLGARSPQTHLQHFLPLYIARSLYSNLADSRRLDSDIRMNSFGAGNQPAGKRLFAAGFHTVSDAYKPAVLWVWNQMLGLERGRLTKLDRASDIAFTLVNYPVDLRPEHPSQVLPRTLQDRQKGGYVFRNRWQDQNDIVAQLYFKSDPRRATWWCVGDGAFRIDGLGHSWVVKGAGHKHQVQDRRFENVVQFSDPINGWLGGQVTHFQAQPDGSGTVSAILDNTYLGQRQQENGKRLPLADLSAQILRENTVELGIRGMRVFAADYSGAAGVPAVFAVVDKISGGDDKVWQLIVAREHRISIAGNVFMVTAADGATLQGTFVVPVAVELGAIAPQTFNYRNLKGQPQTDTIPLQGIQARGGSNFFVVMTLQNSTPPEVKISGTGLTATATIGNQTICFVEHKIRVGQCQQTSASKIELRSRIDLEDTKLL